jgi:hypothetical protein
MLSAQKAPFSLHFEEIHSKSTPLSEVVEAVLQSPNAKVAQSRAWQRRFHTKPPPIPVAQSTISLEDREFRIARNPILIEENKAKK